MYKSLFLIMLMISTIISISSMSWMMAWIGLEINLLALMPLLKTNNNNSTEAIMKYFMIQAMASAIFLFSIIIFIDNDYLKPFKNQSLILLNSSLLLKLGVAPFHFWLPEVISGLNWKMNFIMLTWQKISPMILLSYNTNTTMYLSIIIIMSSFISSIQGLNQTCMRKIFAYSSINHMSWMISALMNSMSTWLIYFIIYSMMNMNIMIIFNKYKIYYLNQMSYLFYSNKYLKYFFMLNFLNLGGLPPFLGFFPKWLTVNFMILNNHYITTVILIIFSLISLYFYMRITFSSFSFYINESIKKTFNKIHYMHFFMNFMSLMSLTICTMMVNFL
uniref:NADH-ubiquinone oxidoreductase chain 2 n=1 Tax=Pantoxystus rubricollis TaxID=1738269 RepID=A0A343C1T1_9CUCU|nr:NADH dehydrogenase subunit 2 [Pantoxystus rubricollis]